MFWSKLFKSNWSCAWNLAFPVFISPIVWNMCENLYYESVYFKDLLKDQEYCWPTRAGEAAARSPALHVCVKPPPPTQASPAPVTHGRLQPHTLTTAVLVIHKGQNKRFCFIRSLYIEWLHAQTPSPFLGSTPYTYKSRRNRRRYGRKQNVQLRLPCRHQSLAKKTYWAMIEILFEWKARWRLVEEEKLSTERLSSISASMCRKVSRGCQRVRC